MRYATLVLLASAMLAIAVSAASGRNDADAAASGRIAFSYRFWPKDKVDNYEIFVMDVDGGGESENLTRYPQCSEVDPAWSHSGRWLAFACEYGRHAGIGVMRDDRAERRRVVRAASRRQWSEPAWSPDDRQLALKGAKGIWLANVDGSGRRRLTRGMDGSPTWSPDGRELAFDRTSRGSRHIVKIRANGTGRHTIARKACCPVWSHDGRSIAFLKNGRLWVMSSDGRGKHLVPRVPRGLEITDLAWSPDSRYVAYYVYCCREAGIYITSLDGTDRKYAGGGAEFLGISWGL